MSFITILIALLTPIITAVVLLALKVERPRHLAAAAATLSLVLVVLMPDRNPVMLLPAITHALLILGVVILMPKQDATPQALAGILIIASSTQLCYSSSNLALLSAGWWLTLVPFVAGLFGSHTHQRWSQSFLVLSALSLTIGSMTGQIAFFVAAIVLRKGVFPLHGGALAKFEHGSLIPAALLFNSHLGAVIVTQLPHNQVMEWLGIAALASSVLLALRTFAEKKPRRMLALISLSQASFILAGLTLRNTAGVTGALLHWFVVSIACVGLACVLRAVEVRVTEARQPSGYLGLAVKTPRLATFFLLCAFALIGMPGTLGYCAEDLLFHGAIEEHVVLGIALPLATAFNAIHLIRLFGILFLGVLPKNVPDVPDALPRERWPLAVAACALIFFGLMPRAILHYTLPAVQALGLTSFKSP